jgi:hypothetical protein
MEVDMLPWYWTWSPKVRYPFSGDVVQDISPDTNWFFGAIKPQAGIGSIEKEIFDVASYGKQLGLILDVLLPLAGEGSLDSEKARQSLADLKAVYREIEKVKTAKRAEMEHTAVTVLERIERTDPAMLKRVLNRFETQ